MRHIPHLVVAAPWDGDLLPLSIVQWRHVSKVLRLQQGDTVTYTDGLGTAGSGSLESQAIRRGQEHRVARPSEITVVVAPPANKDRQRYLVEKLTELGVARLQWLETEHGKNRPVAAPKVFSWVVAALEQSRGAWLMETPDGMVRWEDLTPHVVVCDRHGADGLPEARTVVVGPEGGWGDDEIPAGVERWNLGPTVLRTETAAVVAVSRLTTV